MVTLWRQEVMELKVGLPNQAFQAPQGQGLIMLSCFTQVTFHAGLLTDTEYIYTAVLSLK